MAGSLRQCWRGSTGLRGEGSRYCQVADVLWGVLGRAFLLET